MGGIKWGDTKMIEYQISQIHKAFYLRCSPTIFMNQIKINNIARILGKTLTVAGIKAIKSSYDNLKPVKLSFGFLKTSFDKVKDTPITERDLTYYFTDWNNWAVMTNIIYSIVKNFKWEAEKHDCDDRAKLVSALCSLFFGLNTCGELYCEVTSIKTGNKIGHWANVIITSNGECYLFDVSNSGLTMRLYPDKYTMGKWSYKFFRIRF